MNTDPISIQRSRQHKQISPNGLPIVYVGRGGFNIMSKTNGVSISQVSYQSIDFDFSVNAL